MKLKYVLYCLVLFSLQVKAQECFFNGLQATTPDSRFNINLDGTITDKKTGLMWKRCSEGKSGSTCGSGSFVKRSWKNALNYVKTLNDNGGFADSTQWRLPNIKELNSITELACSEPSINLNIFPATPFGSTADRYWSSTTTVSSPAEAWYLRPDNGSDYYTAKDTNLYYIRLVRDAN